ncbi:MAG: FHA domain-containing serine/threonine-protein kinase [Haloarculaceae archaeon]
MSPSPGETIADRFELRERVGSGGFATVWRAHDTDRDADVALKCADVGTHDRTEVHDRFEREIRTLGRFEGAIAPSSVVRYLAGDTDAPTPYIALEFLPGAPLSDRLGAGGLGTSVRRRVVLDLAATMDFLHRNGVVYLDLRPENVIVRDSGRPVLLDFNTAATVDGPIETRFEADQFKPPELLPAVGESGDPGPWSDVYAWGKLAFYLFTDAKVLPGDVPDDGLDPLDFGGTCEREVANVVRRATVPDPDERFDDGTTAAGALARATGRQRALLTQPATGVACPIADGETMGRLDDGTPAPWIVIPDEGRHVSPRHARFVYTARGWTVQDTSLNGTYVGGPDGWTHLLSERGRAARDDGATGKQTEATVPDGAPVAPVHPEYGIELQLSPLADPTDR